MSKEDVVEFFDKEADTWDSHMVRDDRIINTILNYADICEGTNVLDVACGTGVVIPDYLKRGAKKVIGVDISPKMIKIALSKFHDERVEFINADIEELVVEKCYDRYVIYNAFPHFEYPERLIRHLSESLPDGGRLTIAHSMSRKQLNKHHSGRAKGVSHNLMSEQELAALMKPYFNVDVMVSDEEMYVVSGSKA